MLATSTHISSVALIARTFLVAGSVDRLKEEVKRLRRELRESNARRDHFQRVCAEQQATLAGLQEQMAAMQEQLALFKKALFAPRRERHVPSADQKLLFAAEACDAGADAPAAEADDEPPPARRRRQKRQRFVFPDFLPVKRVECPLTDDELAARFGPDGWRILKELVSRQIEVVPPQAYVVEEVRFVYAAKDSAAGVAPLTAEKRPSINPKGVFGPLAIAYLAEAKYGRHLPLYRIQEELLAATDTWFARSVLSGALLRPAERLLPLVELMHRRILQGDYASVDETPARVLRPGTGQVGRPYLWVYVGDPAHPYAVFDYRLDRSRAGPQAMLGDYSGAIMSDGYVVYESLAANSGNRLTDLGCWAHVRRKFDEACAVTAHPLAHEALAWIGQLYDLEDQVKLASPEQRSAARRRVAAPIVAQLRERLVACRSEIRPSTKLARAVDYALGRWQALTRFVSDARYPLDNNVAERALRPTVVGRKNYLFYGSDDGGSAAAIWYSIIQSARANHVRVLAYLQDLVVRLPQIVPEYLRVGDAPSEFAALSPTQLAELERLLPDRWLAEHPDCRAEHREAELEQANRRRRRRRAARRTNVKAAEKV